MKLVVRLPMPQERSFDKYVAALSRAESEEDKKWGVHTATVETEELIDWGYASEGAGGGESISNVDIHSIVDTS